MGHLRHGRGRGMPQGPAWSGMAGLGHCTMSGSWSGQPQVWLKRTRVRTRIDCGTNWGCAWPAGAATIEHVRLAPSHGWRSALPSPTLRTIPAPSSCRNASRSPGGVAQPLSRGGRGRASGAGPARPRRGGTPLRRHAADNPGAVDRACRPGGEVGRCRSAGCCCLGWHGDGIAALLTGLRDHIGKDRAWRQLGSIAPVLSPSRGNQDLLDPGGVAPE